MIEITFKNKKINIQKLLSYGFAEQESCYTYSADLAYGQMKLTVTITSDGKIYTEIIDNGTGEEYVLHRIAGTGGAFVGQVKNEYENILDDISVKCFEADVFKSDDAKRIMEYVRNTYSDELEFLWNRFPDNAVVRRKDNKKWYAAILTVSRRKLGFDSDEMVEILDLRIKPDDMKTLIDNKKYFPGYHMNKKHWYTICLDGTVSAEEIFTRIDNSYELAKK